MVIRRGHDCVERLHSEQRVGDSFTGQKTQPTVSKY